MGMHTSIEKILEGRGSLDRAVHHSAMEAFSKEGNVLLFTCDRKDYTHILPDNCRHVRMYSKIIYIFLSCFIISIYANKHKLDYLYYFSGSSVFGIPFANLLSKAKVIHYSDCLLHTSVHSNSDFNDIKRWFYLRLERFAYRFIDYLIICSAEIYNFTMSTKFNGTVLPFGKSIPINHKYATNHSNRRVIWIGRLEEVKNPLFAILMWVYGSVTEKHPDAELVIVGDGSLLSVCRQMSAVLESQANIRVIGQQHNIHEWLAKSDVLISTSSYEATPDVIFEAMSVGLPVVALDNGGVNSIVVVQTGQNGMLIDKASYRDYANAVCSLLGDRKLTARLGKRGQELILKENNSLTNSLKLVEFLKNEKRGWI